MLARFEEDGAKDKRSAARRSLRLTLRGPGAGSGGQKLIVHDLSSTGLLLETTERLSVGEMFRVRLPEATATKALVVWHSGHFYGCQFKRPISTAALSAALLRSASLVQEEARLNDVDFVTELRSLSSRVRAMSLKVEQIIGCRMKDLKDR